MMTKKVWEKVVSAAEAVSVIQSGDRVYNSSGLVAFLLFSSTQWSSDGKSCTMSKYVICSAS